MTRFFTCRVFLILCSCLDYAGADWQPGMAAQIKALKAVLRKYYLCRISG